MAKQQKPKKQYQSLLIYLCVLISMYLTMQCRQYNTDNYQPLLKFVIYVWSSTT